MLFDGNEICELYLIGVLFSEIDECCLDVSVSQSLSLVLPPLLKHWFAIKNDNLSCFYYKRFDINLRYAKLGELSRDGILLIGEPSGELSRDE